MSGYLSPWYLSLSSPTWIELTAAGSKNWQDFDLVNDRTKIIGIADHTYTSYDSGASWAQKTDTGYNYSQDYTSRCKMSDDGVKFCSYFRSSFNSALYIYNSVDSGSTFPQNNTQNSSYGGGFDATSDCSLYSYYIATGSANSGIYRAYSLGGGNFVNNGGENEMAASALAVNYDTSRVIAAGFNIIRVSSDNGNSFTNYTNSYFTIDVASSDTGDKAILCINGTGYLKHSSDYGVSWSDNTAAGSRAWKGVCISDSGTIRIAWTASLILRSTDSGASWTDITFPGAASITRCGLSGDGLTVISSNNPGIPRIINF